MTTSERPGRTTDSGAPWTNADVSRTAGPGGPISLIDHQLIEHMAQFNRERVPERVVHAKGSGAFGTFTVTDDISAFTKADLFSKIGGQTEVVARFSTVAGEQGSPDTWRDPRGFSLKFYTQQGNWDMVGNNTPVFFVRDPMKFQDFIRSQKRLPQNGLRDHNMQWDFWSRSPESLHQVTYLMGDRGIPKSYRHMDGYGSHTFAFVNAEGKRTWVKFHFKTDQGIEWLGNDEADRLAGTDPDLHREDLFTSIDTGDFPSWTMYVQLMPDAEAAGYRFNPFDVTKIWSQKDFPLHKVGVLELNKNPDNFFAQIEQGAWEPSALVPGIELSPDPMLQGRVFSYADAHRYRIGTNYAQLPVNMPKVPVNTYNKDGAMAYHHAGDQPVYNPNGTGPIEQPTFEESSWPVSGSTGRFATPHHDEDDDYRQAGDLYRLMDDAAKDRIVETITTHMGGGQVDREIQERQIEHFRNADPDFGARIAKGLGVS